jgi:hypothetical protein
LEDLSQEARENLTAGQRAMFAADAVERGEFTKTDAAAHFGASKSGLEKALRIKKRDKHHSVASSVRRGKATLDDGARRVGLVTGHAPIRRGAQVTRGDKWFLATEPLRRYLRHWTGREYTHINHKEATKRLKLLRELQRDLAILEQELERRSVRAKLSMRGE